LPEKAEKMLLGDLLRHYFTSMTRKRSIPKPPKKPSFPSDKHVRQIERDYVKRHRLPRLRAARAITAPAVERQLQLEFLTFERKNVLDPYYKPWERHVIICEGDSWFNHPFLHDIPEQLLDFGYSVRHSNKPGKHLEESYNNGNGYFLAPLRDNRKSRVKALLLSGGGNDLINWHKDNSPFSPIFRKTQSDNPADYIDSENLKKALAGLTELLSKIASNLRDVGAEDLPVLLHCYDYITPKNYGPWPFKGTYVNPQLDVVCPNKGPSFRQQITKLLQEPWISAYKAACERLHWQFVETQGLVKGRWHDEIHPTNDAFYDIASEYWRVLHKIGVTPDRTAREMRLAA
jgi:hypothetical protein